MNSTDTTVRPLVAETPQDPVCELMAAAMAAEPIRRGGPLTRRRRIGTRTEAPDAVAEATMSARLVAAVTEAVVATVDGRIAYLNPAAEALYGCSAATALGRPAAEVVTWDLHPGEIAALLTARPDMHTWSGEVGVREGREQILSLTVKPLLAEGIPVAVAAVAHDVTATRAVHRTLERRAREDDLTGLPNRRALCEELDAMLGAEPALLPACVVVRLDVHDLRLVNDAFGHDASDRAIASIARCLRGAAHGGDLVARVSSSSFAICCPHLDTEGDLVGYADALRAAVAQPGVAAPDDRVLVSSAGVAVGGTDGDDAEELLQRADIALTQAIERGRGRSRLYDHELRRQLHRHLELERAIRAAIVAGEVGLAYQPIVRLAEDRVVGAEALLRLAPDGDPLPAGEVIDVAERSGLIVELGDLILATACIEAARWQRVDPLRRLTVSVNVSAAQLEDEHLPDRVEAVLASTGLHPSLLILEMTETMLMADSERSIRQLGRLKALGVLLAADDFGTGYSSLAYLKRFPLDAVKADLSFVAGLPDSPEDVAVVAAIVAIAGALNLRVVAEGVEDERQLAELRRLGCSHGQGWHWSKAVPGAEFLVRALAIDPLAGSVARG